MNNILNDEPTAIHEILTLYTQGELENISKGGCVSGAAPHHITYTETSDFYNRHEDEILDFLENVTGENPLQVYIKDSNTVRQLQNKIVWAFIDLLASVHAPQ